MSSLKISNKGMCEIFNKKGVRKVGDSVLQIEKRREFRFVGKLAAQGKSFRGEIHSLLTLLKLLLLYLWLNILLVTQTLVRLYHCVFFQKNYVGSSNQ